MTVISGFAGGAVIRQTLAGGDAVPDAFSIPPSSGAPLSTVVTSVGVTPVGYDTGAAISVSAGGEYEIDLSGSWVSTPGTINPGSSFRVRKQSSASNNTTVTATVTIGGVSADYNITTIAAAAGGGGGLFIPLRRNRR